MTKITLAAARVNAGMTQAQASKTIGVDKATIINWEKGRTSPKSDQLQKLCKIYSVPMDFIFLPDTLLKVDKDTYTKEA